MSDDQTKRKSDADAELEREIRRERKFSLADAIGRMAGPGSMKGVSPVTRKQQAEVEIENYLRVHLPDAAGALGVVVLRRVRESELLLGEYDQPLAILARGIRRVLGSDHLLAELVRETDIEWARVLGERPHFEQEGTPPHPDDPYTIESVRSTLSKMLEKLTAGEK